ncbi:MAG TPA: SIS domain-containing protein [Nocardioidaceae bacterium]|nr:SIS domain-containing protein [Nocardioidaceae bacterium]
MASDGFDDSLLDDERSLAPVEADLRRLAESGARVRRETDAAAEANASLEILDSPRALVVAGVDARLLRAVLEPWCPVPFVAWPGPGLPGWAGALDLVLVLAPAGGDSGDSGATSAVTEAVRRGCGLIVACPPHSMLAEHAQGRYSIVLPTYTEDPLAAAVVMLQAMHRMGLGPEVNAESVASALDDVAIACSPGRDLSDNPAKDLAITLADALPLVWGGSVLAARAARRVAELIRRNSGRPALAADAEHLLPVLASLPGQDVFADPFADPYVDGPAPARPALVILDDGADAPAVREQRGRLLAVADQHQARVYTVVAGDGPDVARYASLLSTGSYAATYLGVGLGRPQRP